MKTIDQLINEHAAKIRRAHENDTFGDYTSEGLLTAFTLDLVDNGHIPRAPTREV